MIDPSGFGGSAKAKCIPPTTPGLVAFYLGSLKNVTFLTGFVTHSGAVYQFVDLPNPGRLL
jgi:hypothetical protein